MSHDKYADWDGAYVLGALSPAERHEYEVHLAGCPECGTAVRELAGIPGLLARARELGVQATGALPRLPQQRPPAQQRSPGGNAGDVADPDGAIDAGPADVTGPQEPFWLPEPEPLPDSLLPSLEAHVSAARRRRLRTLTSWAAAAAVAATVVLASTLGTRDTGGGTPAATPPSQVVASVGADEGQAFTPVAGAPAAAAAYSVRAVLVDQAGGALVLLRCAALTSTSYGTGRGGIHKSQDVHDLELWSVDESGARQLTTWAPRPVGQVVQARATATVPVARLGTLEVRALGRALLRLEVRPR